MTKYLVLLVAVIITFFSSCEPETITNVETLNDTIIVVDTIIMMDSSDICFTLSNITDMDRIDEALTISKEDLNTVLGKIPEGKLPLLCTESQLIPTQVDDIDNDGEWDEIFALINIKSQEKLNIKCLFVEADNYPVFKARTNVRLARQSSYKEVDGVNRTSSASSTYQFEGPGWENDKIAFRNYFDARNGMDIFGKKVSYMVLDDAGVTIDYHDAPWGRDILTVGSSLGAGGIALLIDNSIYRVNAMTDSKFFMVTEGPLRSIFNLTFMGFTAAGNTFDITQQISIIAGRYHYTSTINIVADATNTKIAQLVVGLVSSKNKLYVNDVATNHESHMTYGNQSDRDNIIGMGVLASKEMLSDTPTDNLSSTNGITLSHYVVFDQANNDEIIYHFFSGWEFTDDAFKTLEGYQGVVAAETELMETPLLLEMRK